MTQGTPQGMGKVVGGEEPSGDAGSASRRVLCLGTSPTLQRTMVFEQIHPGDTNRAETVLEYASGKAVNAARVLHGLGRDVLYLGQVGGDRGRAFRRDLEQAGVPHDLVEVAPDTRLCVTVVNRAGRMATELIEETREVPDTVGRTLLDRFADHLGQGAAVAIVSGSIAPGLPASFYAEAIRLASEANVPTLLDARGEPLRAALGQAPHVVKPNRAELAATVSQPVESRNAMHEAMAAIIEQGAQWVICTRGRDGSSVCGRPEGTLRFWEIAAPRVSLVNAVGSGDAYAAGLAAGLAEGVQLPDACRYASACGAANAEMLVAGQVDPDRVAALVGDCLVREVA